MSDMTTTGDRTPARRTERRDLKTFLNSPAVRSKLAEVASAAMKPDDLIRLALIAASRAPDLEKCTEASILRALLDASALGIQPGGLMGRGYLVPRKNGRTNTTEAHFDPGWRGLVDIARRSGQIRRIEAHAVHELDTFVVERSPLTTVRHVPNEGAEPGPIRAAYAVAEFTGGELQIEIVWKRDLDKIRRLGADKGPWASWADEMARKTAVRRLCKYLPYDPMLERAMAASDAADDVDFGVDVEPAPKMSIAEKVRAKQLKGASRTAPTEPAPPSAQKSGDAKSSALQGASSPTPAAHGAGSKPGGPASPPGTATPPHDPETGEIGDEYPTGDPDEGP